MTSRWKAQWTAFSLLCNSNVSLVRFDGDRPQLLEVLCENPKVVKKGIEIDSFITLYWNNIERRVISSKKGLFILSSTVYDTSNSTSGTGVSRRRLDVPSRVAERPPLPRPTAWPPCAWTGFFYGTWKSVSCKRCTSNAGVGQYHIFGRDFNSGPSHNLNPIKHLWRFYVLGGREERP